MKTLILALLAALIATPRAHRISDRRHQGQAKFPSRGNLPLRFRRGVAQLPVCAENSDSDVSVMKSADQRM